jgi:hypothetical protein
MAKSRIKVRLKRRGRPATGKDPLYTFRIPDELMQRVDQWGKERIPEKWERTSRVRSEAVRRLLELGLGSRRDD